MISPVKECNCSIHFGSFFIFSPSLSFLCLIISLYEVKKIANIEFDDEIDLSTAQFILRDNNELDVNYYTKDEIDYAFNCCIYFLDEDKLNWDLSENIHGYMDVLLNENSWDVLEEMQ